MSNQIKEELVKAALSNINIEEIKGIINEKKINMKIKKILHFMNI